VRCGPRPGVRARPVTPPAGWTCRAGWAAGRAASVCMPSRALSAPRPGSVLATYLPQRRSLTSSGLRYLIASLSPLAPCVLVDQAEPERDIDGLGPVVGSQLLEDALEMGFHRVRRDAE